MFTPHVKLVLWSLMCSTTCSLCIAAAREQDEQVQHSSFSSSSSSFSSDKTRLPRLTNDLLTNSAINRCNSTLNRLVIKLNLTGRHAERDLKTANLHRRDLKKYYWSTLEGGAKKGELSSDARSKIPSSVRREVGGASDVITVSSVKGVGRKNVTSCRGKPETENQSIVEKDEYVNDVLRPEFSRSEISALCSTFGVTCSKSFEIRIDKQNRYSERWKSKRNRRSTSRAYANMGSLALTPDHVASEKGVSQPPEELLETEQERVEDSLLQLALDSSEFAQFSVYIERLPKHRQEEIFWWLHDHYYDADKRVTLSSESDRIIGSSKVSQETGEGNKKSSRKMELFHTDGDDFDEESKILVKRLFLEDDLAVDDDDDEQLQQQQRAERFLNDDYKSLIEDFNNDVNERNYFDADEFGLVDRDIDILDDSIAADDDDVEQQQKDVALTELNVRKYVREAVNDSNDVLPVTSLPPRHVASHSAVAEALRNNAGRLSLVATGTGNSSSQLELGDRKYAQVLRLLTESRKAEEEVRADVAKRRDKVEVGKQEDKSQKHKD